MTMLHPQTAVLFFYCHMASQGEQVQVLRQEVAHEPSLVAHRLRSNANLVELSLSRE